MIALGEFMRADRINRMALWTWVAAVKLAAFIWAASVATRQVFGLESHKSLAYPFAALATVFSTVFFEERMTFRNTCRKCGTHLNCNNRVHHRCSGLSYVVRRLLVPAHEDSRSRPRHGRPGQLAPGRALSRISRTFLKITNGHAPVVISVLPNDH